MAVFTWNVDANPVQTKKPRVSNIRFGDGYEQRVSHGINTNPQEWTVSYANRSSVEAREIDDFLIARGGVEAFEWTPPGQLTQLKFKCQEWSEVVHKGDLYSISAKFEQVFDP